MAKRKMLYYIWEVDGAGAGAGAVLVMVLVMALVMMMVTTMMIMMMMRLVIVNLTMLRTARVTASVFLNAAGNRASTIITNTAVVTKIRMEAISTETTG